MIVYNREDKKLVVPSALGNFGNAGGGSGSGLTPEEVAEIASAVTEAAIEEYDTEIQVDLEEIRDAISGNTDTLLDLAVIAAMSVADRVALFDEVFEKASNGERIYIKGLVQEETVRTAVLPLVSYRPETNPVLHQGGNLYFAAKGDTDNIYFHIGLTSEGSIDPTSGNIIKRNIYNLPTASAEVKGGVRIGSGFTMAQDVISVDTTGLVTDGDLAPFVAELSAATEDLAALSGSVNDIRSDVGTLSGATSDILSDIEALSGITESVSGAVDTLSGITTANTENIATLSAATEAISGSLGNYATTATTDALSAVTSALTENLEALSAVTSGLVSAQDIVYDYAVISTYTAAQKQALWNEISGYKNTNKKVWIRHQLGTEVKWYLCYKFDVPYIYFVANDNRKIYYLMFNQTGSFSNSEYVIQSAISAGSGVSISNNVVSLNIGEGLAFSGNTLVVSGISGGGNVFVIYDIWAQNTQLADFLFQYANNGSISSGFPEDTRILLWLGQDFQGAFDSHSQGFVELYPSELKDVEGTDVFFLGGVYATSDTDAYAVRVGYTEQGYPSNNWIERVRQDIAVYKPAFVRFGNDERGYLIYDADNDRFEYNNGYVATGDTTTVCPDLIDKLFTNYIFDGGDIWTGSEYLYPLNTNKFYVKQNGETTTYAAPRIKRKQLASTVTIDGVNFDWEITYDYGDWILTAYYAGNEGNDAANLRISANA